MLEKAEIPPQVETLVEGPVISIQKSSVFIDLAPFGTGIIFGREFINAKDIIKSRTLRRNHLLRTHHGSLAIAAK
jgi:ribosomal protein S1